MSVALTPTLHQIGAHVTNFVCFYRQYRAQGHSEVCVVVYIIFFENSEFLSVSQHALDFLVSGGFFEHIVNGHS